MSRERFFIAIRIGRTRPVHPLFFGTIGVIRRRLPNKKIVVILKVLLISAR